MSLPPKVFTIKDYPLDALKRGDSKAQHAFLHANIWRLTDYLERMVHGSNIPAGTEEDIALSILVSVIYALERGALIELETHGKLLRAIIVMANIRIQDFRESEEHSTQDDKPKVGFQSDHKRRNLNQEPLHLFRSFVTNQLDPEVLANLVNDPEHSLEALPLKAKSVYFLRKQGLTNRDIAVCLEISFPDVINRVAMIKSFRKKGELHVFTFK